MFGAGHLDVLAIGRGHLRLQIPENDALEREKAQRIIEDMLHRGYAIFVELPAERVRAFDPERFAYLIDEPSALDREALDAATAPPPATESLSCSACGRTYAKRPGPGAQPKRCPDCRASKKLGRPVTGIPVDKAKATGVGRVAGGSDLPPFDPDPGLIVRRRRGTRLLVPMTVLAVAFVVGSILGG